MVRSEALILLFAALLGELALSGCSGLRSCPRSETRVQEVEPAALTSALEDGELSDDECSALCWGRPLTGDTSSTDEGTTMDTGTRDQETAGVPTTSVPIDSTTFWNDLPPTRCQAVDGESAKLRCKFKYSSRIICVIG